MTLGGRASVKKHIVLGAGSAVAASACMALFGTGIASADDYAGMTYAELSAASDAGDTTWWWPAGWATRWTKTTAS